MNWLPDDEEDAKNEVWAIVREWLPEVDAESLPSQIEINTLLEPPIYRKLAIWFLCHRRTNEQWNFIGTDQLVGMASKVPLSESDIDKVPGVYIFFLLKDRKVLKVGQSNNMRQRIVFEHLRKETMNTDSLLIDYAKRHWIPLHNADWYGSLRDHEVVAILCPFVKYEDCDRLLMEQSLISTLHPLMP